MQVHGSLDLSHNQLQNFKVDTRLNETDINNVAGVEGQLVYLEQAKKLYLCIQSSPSVIWLNFTSGLSAVHEQSTQALNWNVNHNLGTEDVNVQVFDQLGKVIIPEEIEIVDENNLIVRNGSAALGKVVIVGLDGGTALQLSSEREKILSQPGELVVATGTARWYPSWNVELVSIFASVDTAPEGTDILIDMNKNGTTILNSPLTIAAGTNSSGTFTDFTTTSITNIDYVTIDVDQIGSAVKGSNLQVRIIYKAISF